MPQEDAPPSDTLFEVPDGFWDEPGEPMHEEPAVPQPAVDASSDERAATEPDPAPAGPAAEPAPDSGLALIQEIFPGRVISQQPLLVSEPAETPEAEPGSEVGDQPPDAD